MHSEPRRHTPAESTTPELQGAAALARAVARVAADRGERETLERVTINWLVHPEGGACDEAALLLWNPRRGCFQGWLRELARPDRPMEDALSDGPDGRDPDARERTARFRRFLPTPGELGEAARSAWESGEPASGPWGLESGWTETEHAYALRLDVDACPTALLVVRRASGPAAVETLVAAVAVLEDGVRVARLAAQRQKRERHLELLAEMAASCVSSMNVAEALHLAARLAVRGTGARGSAVWRVQNETPCLEVTHGAAGQRERIARGLSILAQDAVATQSMRIVENAAEDPRIARDVVPDVPTLVMQPVVAYGRSLGAVAVYDRTVLHPADDGSFDAADLRFVSLIAQQLALVLDQAFRYDTVRTMQQQLDDLRSWMRREERLASLGEVAARGAREVRNPLASVAAFARRAHREMAEDDPHREYLEIVIREADRVERIMDEQLDWATQPSARLEVLDVTELIQRALQAAGERIVRRRVRLLKNLAPDLPPLLIDPERMRLVLDNLLHHALEAVAVGGRVRVASRRAGGFVITEVSHDGPRNSGGFLEDVFIPFAASHERGPAVGLGVANQVVREHGGEIRARSDAEWSQVITFSLPVRGNEDRRGQPSDRRSQRSDRRGRFPAV